MYLGNTIKQFNKTTKGEKMEKIFTSNWHIYRVCLPSILNKHDVEKEKRRKKT
jgi:hypothetical protein